MISDDVDDTPVPSMRSSALLHLVVAVTHANDGIWLTSARKPCACFVVSVFPSGRCWTTRQGELEG